MNKKALTEIYNAYAPEYSKLIEKTGWWAPRVVSSFLKPYLRPGDRVLDAACGDGYSSLKIMKICDVYGFDLAQEMVKAARKSRMKEVCVHDADETFPYRDHFFDSALGLGFLEFVQNMHFTLCEFKRVVKTGGYILITVEDLDPNIEKQREKYEKVIPGVKKTRYSRTEMLRFIKKAGLITEVDERIFGYKSESLMGSYYYHYYLLRNFKKTF